MCKYTVGHNVYVLIIQRTDLLEKSRITRQQPEERNYHIFYQMLAGITDELKATLHLGSAADYHYLNTSGCTSIEGVDDAKDFNRTTRYAGWPTIFVTHVRF